MAESNRNVLMILSKVIAYTTDTEKILAELGDYPVLRTQFIGFLRSLRSFKGQLEDMAFEYKTMVGLVGDNELNDKQVEIAMKSTAEYKKDIRRMLDEQRKFLEEIFLAMHLEGKRVSDEFAVLMILGFEIVQLEISIGLDLLGILQAFRTDVMLHGTENKHASLRSGIQTFAAFLIEEERKYNTSTSTPIKGLSSLRAYIKPILNRDDANVQGESAQESKVYERLSVTVRDMRIFLSRCNAV